MKFEKGKPKTGGRHKGTLNVVTKDLRGCIVAALENTSDRLEKALANLDDKEFVTAWAKLSEYVLPKLQRSELEINQPEVKENDLDFSRLTTAELKEMLRLVEKAKGESGFSHVGREFARR